MGNLCRRRRFSVPCAGGVGFPCPRRRRRGVAKSADVAAASSSLLCPVSQSRVSPRPVVRSARRGTSSRHTRPRCSPWGTPRQRSAARLRCSLRSRCLRGHRVAPTRASEALTSRRFSGGNRGGAATRLRGRSHGVAATRLHGISTSQPRHRRDPSPRNIRVAAAAAPRVVSDVFARAAAVRDGLVRDAREERSRRVVVRGYQQQLHRGRAGARTAPLHVRERRRGALVVDKAAVQKAVARGRGDFHRLLVRLAAEFRDVLGQRRRRERLEAEGDAAFECFRFSGTCGARRSRPNVRVRGVAARSSPRNGLRRSCGVAATRPRHIRAAKVPSHFCLSIIASAMLCTPTSPPAADEPAITSRRNLRSTRRPRSRGVAATEEPRRRLDFDSG